MLYNIAVAWSRPYVEFYNMTLHYINEFTYFFFISMNMTFTDFLIDQPMRASVANMLNLMMFLVMAINVFVCLVSIVFTHKQFWL